jgi:hypothetical protein
MPQLMDEKGLTDEELIEKYLVPLLEATQVKVFNDDGTLIYSEPLIAWDIRLGALREAFKLKGSYAPPPEPAQAYTGIQVIVMDKIPRPNQEKFLELEREFNAQQSANGHKKNGNHNNGDEPEE